MKTSPLLFLALLGTLLAATACSHLDLTPEGDPDRIVSGTINLRSDLALPADAVVVVRVIDPAGIGQQRAAASMDVPTVARPTTPAPAEQVLGEQTITAAAGSAIPFRIEYRADDSLMRHGLNIDARISFGGRVRFRTASAHVLTLANATYTHEVWVESAAR